jgi:hypothetical protein
MFQVGQKVFWHFETTSGWGADFHVPATVLKIGPKRIQIAAELKRGGTVPRWVRPDKLKARD